MSYQVLARKWRPRSFETLVGQEHVVRALTHALSNQRLHHAYLFTGTRGVGKTTIARIMAKALNCETGVTPTPCGTCSACVEIDAGRFVDLIEVDAATNTRVDEMRQLLENATYAPTRGRYKVYVIDEVHMLSNSAFNAMLKTLEEPPEHIKFILATTDPQKIPVTVLSRCLQFNLKQMPPSHIIAHLSRILVEEGIDFEPQALEHLSKAAAGSMRDALSLLDQAIAHGAGRVEDENVRDMLGTVGDDYLFAILGSLLAADVQALMETVDRMEARSLSFEAALQSLATLFHRIALAQFAPQALSADSERKALEPYARGFDAEFLQLAYQIAIHGRNDLPLAPDERAGFCMSLLRLFAFRPEMSAALSATIASPVAPTVSTSPKPADRIPPPLPPSSPSATAALKRPPPAHLSQPFTSAPVSPIAPASNSSAPGHSQSAASIPASVGLADSSASPSSPSTSPPSPPSSPSSPSSPSAGGMDWHTLCARLSLGGMVRSLAQYCELVSMEETLVTLRLPPAQHFLLEKSFPDMLEAELQKYLNRPIRLKILLGDTGSQTPAERKRQVQRERQDQAVASIREDKFVQQMVDLFDATIDESTIQPID